MSAAPANNRFTYKVHRQDRYSVSTPPSSRPTEAPAPAIAPNTANALPRSLGSANVLVRIDNADGAMTAANAPWQARAVTSMAKLTDAPPTADATAKPARPAMNVTLRPSRSASRPPSSSRLPNASAYAVTTHCLSTMTKCSDRCADGSATLTIVRSRTIMSWAMAPPRVRATWSSRVTMGPAKGHGASSLRVRQAQRDLRAAAWRSRRLMALGRWQRSRYWSGRCAAAVDGQDRAVNEAGVVGSQIGDGRGDLVR